MARFSKLRVINTNSPVANKRPAAPCWTKYLSKVIDGKKYPTHLITMDTYVQHAKYYGGFLDIQENPFFIRVSPLFRFTSSN
jgi:hypothetical protein